MPAVVVAADVEPLEPRTLYAAAPAPAVSRPDHVVIVIEENHSHPNIIGSADAPYLNSLAAQGASFTNYRAVTHPSQPNYLALFSGSTHGVLDDEVQWDVSGPNLGAQLFAAGLDFRGYSEDLPYTGYALPDFRKYTRRHNPWVNFPDVPWTANQPLRNFPRPGGFGRLPEVSFVIPNLINDMHDGSVARGDSWLKTHLDPYAQWAKSHNSLLVVTWDEDDMHDDNIIPTIVVGGGVRPGNYAAPVNHYGLLRTVEAMYGLAPLGEAAGASPISEIWQPPAEKAAHLAPVADAFAWDEVPTSNFGNSATLDVKTASTRGQNRDAYFKFDVAGLAAGELSSVRLRFFGALSSAGRVTTGVFAVADSGWTESGLNWNNRPAAGRLLGTTLTVTGAGAWYEVYVTDYVRAERATGQTLVSLCVHNTTGSSARLRIASRESGTNRPELLIVRA